MSCLTNMQKLKHEAADLSKKLELEEANRRFVELWLNACQFWKRREFWWSNKCSLQKALGWKTGRMSLWRIAEAWKPIRKKPRQYKTKKGTSEQKGLSANMISSIFFLADMLIHYDYYFLCPTECFFSKQYFHMCMRFLHVRWYCTLIVLTRLYLLFNSEPNARRRNRETTREGEAFVHHCLLVLFFVPVCFFIFLGEHYS